MPLSALVGNRELLAELVGELKMRPSHGYLLCGPRGAGKVMAAQALALGLLCERTGGVEFCCSLADCPTRAARAVPARASVSARCACCAACIQMALGVHPDCHVIARPAGRAEISIEQVRGLISRLGAKAVRARAQFAIIADAETLSPPAQHALLKTLEEPPVGALIFVIAHNERALLPTVRSRLRLVRLRLLKPQERAAVHPTLAEALDATATPLAGGAFAPSARFFAALGTLSSIDVAAARALAEEFFRDREQAAINFEWLALRLEEILRFKLLGDSFEGFEPITAAAMMKAAQAMELETVITGLELALRALSAVRAIANPALQAENWWLTLGERARERIKDKVEQG
jgi:hypothetical protein